jgi:hypothetical protein
LVVARLFARCVFVIRLKNYQLFLVLDIPVCLVPPPQRVWRGKSIEGKMRFVSSSWAGTLLCDAKASPFELYALGMLRISA